MSRCFPYPPPGYTLSSARNEVLIESIKLQKEKQRKKEKRREKREERKERKERRKEKKDKTNQNLDKSDIVKGHISQVCLDRKGKFLDRRREAETEQFEQSSLTEEHGHPDSLSVPSSSYESTENSNKRKRPSSPVDDSHCHGKAILIRLPSKSQSDFNAVAKGQQPCSMSRGSDFPAQHKSAAGPRDRLENFCCTLEGTSNTEQGSNLRNKREQIRSSSGQIEVVAPRKTGVRSMPNAVANPLQGEELQYNNLLENWFPPRLQDVSLDPVDLDWLFQDGRNQDVRAEKRQRSGIDTISCSRSSALRPRADYLHEIDTYVLPFVVPY